MILLRLHTDDFTAVILKVSEKYVIILVGIINHKESICQCSILIKMIQ